MRKVEKETHLLTADRDALVELLARHSLRFGDFTLASGRKSSIYVDVRLTTFRSEAMPVVGRCVLERLAELGWRPQARAVGGLTLGADPIAFATARESLGSDPPLQAFTVRKEPKGHGRTRQIEGVDDPTGLPVIVVDDVCTTGGSTLKAIAAVREAGMRVIGALSLVDREEGAREAIEAAQCPFASVVRLADVETVARRRQEANARAGEAS